MQKNSTFFQTASRICSCLTHFFTKTFEKTNIFAQAFAKTSLFRKNFAKICQNLMSSKYFHKNGPLFHMLLVSFAFFLQKFPLFSHIFARKFSFHPYHLCTSSLSYSIPSFPRVARRLWYILADERERGRGAKSV